MSYHPNYDNLDAATRAKVRRWMKVTMAITPASYPTSTRLAEVCGDELGLADNGKNAVIPEEVYDIALEFFEED